MAYCVLHITDATKSTDGLGSTLCVMASIVKMINYCYYRKRFVAIIRKLYEMQVFESPDEIAMSQKNTRFIKALSYFFWICGKITIFVSSLKGFRKKNPELALPSWFPWDWEHNTTAFWILWPYALITAHGIADVNIMFDILFSFLMDTIATQFDILGIRLQKLGENVSDYGKELEKLKACVKHHQQLLDGVYQLTSLDIREDYLQFLYTTALMGCIGSESFSFTYFGNRILTSSDALTNRLYFSPWYEMPVYYRKHLILVMESAKKAKVMTAGKFFDLNLALFTTVRISDICILLKKN
ncbi:hypothetical protein HA402_007058 [Bradysia odoriphaga]|nr:hypothetical protein HA402_007058 [Bradysia odoriphaga]